MQGPGSNPDHHQNNNIVILPCFFCNESKNKLLALDLSDDTILQRQITVATKTLEDPDPLHG